MQTIREIFYNHEGNLIDKWDHYFEIYEQYFEKYRGQQINLLEIGVSQGGSIELWKKYFGDQLNIYSVDINPQCEIFKSLTTKLYIGSQEDEGFLSFLQNDLPEFDIIIDDGGHTMRQQILTFEYLFLKLKEGGIYLVEDTHTSYWYNYGGGLKKKSSFIEYSKKIIDSLYSGHLINTNGIVDDEKTKHVTSISFHDSIVVFEKKKRVQPFHLKRGAPRIDDYTVRSSFIKKVKNYIFKLFCQNHSETILKNFRS
jgi:hypothetical protein